MSMNRAARRSFVDPDELWNDFLIVFWVSLKEMQLRIKLNFLWFMVFYPLLSLLIFIAARFIVGNKV